MIDLRAFDKARQQKKSPLTVEQFGTLVGGVATETRKIAWDIMQLQPSSQETLWDLMAQLKSKKEFSGAYVCEVRAI